MVALLLLAAGPMADEAGAQVTSVRLMIDYGDGTIKIITDLPWTKGATVLDVMNAAKARPHGIAFEYRGSGATTFMTRIDDVASQGGGAGKRNWQLWVNTAYADRGFGVYEIQPLDVISWRFGAEPGK
jgi:hypothetical protein